MFFFFWTHCCWKLVFLFISFVVVFVLFGTWRITLSRVLFRWLVLEEFGLARKALFFWVYLVLFTILPDRTFFFLHCSFCFLFDASLIYLFFFSFYSVVASLHVYPFSHPVVGWKTEGGSGLSLAPDLFFFKGHLLPRQRICAVNEGAGRWCLLGDVLKSSAMRRPIKKKKKKRKISADLKEKEVSTHKCREKRALMQQQGK